MDYDEITLQLTTRDQIAKHLKTDGTSQAEQWGMVGDVFVVGCKLPSSCVYPEFNALNPDMNDERYNTATGIYEEGCGLDNLELAWGHDEYLYQVLNKLE